VTNAKWTVAQFRLERGQKMVILNNGAVFFTIANVYSCIILFSLRARRM